MMVVFCDPAGPVGQEGVKDCNTSFWLLVGLVKSKVVDFVQECTAVYNWGNYFP